jgi:hypothetical protein
VAAFPTTIRYDWRDLSETVASVVTRTEMERGVPKQRRTNSDALVRLGLTLNFRGKADYAAFETWFYTQINAGADFFDFVHPRTGATIAARFVGGNMGQVRHATQDLQYVLVQTELEYLRAAY